MDDYKEFFDEAPVALIRSDVVSGKITMANKHAATMLGFEAVDDLLQTRATDYYPADIRQRLIKRLKRNKTLENHEVELHLHDGNRIWVRANFRLNCGGDCIECYMTDISELVSLRQKQLDTMKTLSEKIDVRIAAFA